MTKGDTRVSDEAVREATGRTWKEWQGWLDDRGAADLPHKEIVRLLGRDGGVESGWWRQTVTGTYEKLIGRRATGETLDTGFQIGVQRTVAIPAARAWRLLTSPAGVAAWLGEGGVVPLEEGESYRLANGSGEVRVLRPGQHLRVTWQPGDWPRASTIQARVTPKGEKTVIGFHEEHLPSAETREARRSHFRAALATLLELAEETEPGRER